MSLESDGVWIQARVSRAFLSEDGRIWTLQAWVRWRDGSFGTFSADFPEDPHKRPGQPVTVLVDPRDRLRHYRIVLDPAPDIDLNTYAAQPADEPDVAGRVLSAFAAAPAGGPSRDGPPRPASTNQLPVWLGVVFAAFIVLIGSRFGRAGGLLGTGLFLATIVAAVALLATTVAGPWCRAGLRRRGVRVPAVVTDIRQRLVRVQRTSILAWEVAASASGAAGQALKLVSAPLRDDPSAWCPPGSRLTAVIDPADPERHELLLGQVQAPT